MGEKQKSGKGQQKIGTVPMLCGCGFSTTSVSAWAKHKRDEHNNKTEIKGPPTQKRFQKKR